MTCTEGNWHFKALCVLMCEKYKYFRIAEFSTWIAGFKNWRTCTRWCAYCCYYCQI